MPDTRPTILHTEASCGWGGQEIRILEESRLLVERGYRVDIACPRESTLFVRAPDWGFRPIPFPIVRRTPRALMVTRSLLEGYRGAVVNTHSSTDAWLVAAASRLMRARPVIVRTRHVSTPVSRSPTSQWLYARGADHVVTTGESVRRDLIERLHLHPDRVISVPTGVDPVRFHPRDPGEARVRLGLPPDRPVIGILATIRPWKGHLYLLDAFARSGLDQWSLIIVGDGPHGPAVSRRIGELGIEHRVRMVGQQADPVLWLQAMDIVCQPSYASEGVSQSVLQAMMCARPVVSTPIGATEEALAHGHTGIMVPPRNVDALAAAIRDLAGSRERREELGQRARMFAAAHFANVTMADKMESVFLSVLRSHSRPR
jgi:glycosyltransferase involved in cell wall biosynthesis